MCHFCTKNGKKKDIFLFTYNMIVQRNLYSLIHVFLYPRNGGKIEH